MAQRTASVLRVLLLSSLAAAGLPAPAAGAPDAGARCQKATAKAVTQCAAKTASAEEGCFGKTGAACPAGDKKLVKALDGLAKQIENGCTDASAVAAAGYAPLDPAGLVARLGAACTREAGDVAARAYGGADGPLLGSATASDRKCLLTAGKEAGRLLAKGLGAVSKCVGKSCDAEAPRPGRGAAREARGGRREEARERSVRTSRRSSVSTSTPSSPRRAAGRSTPPPRPATRWTRTTASTPSRTTTSASATPRRAPGAVSRSRARHSPTTRRAWRVDPAKWNVVDGFSVGPTILLFDDQLDLAQSGAPPITDLARSIDPASPVLLLDAETGARQLLWLERDQQGPTPAERAIIGHVGANLENGTPLPRGDAEPEGRQRRRAPRRGRLRRLPRPHRRPASSRSRRGARTWRRSSASSTGFGVARSDLYLGLGLHHRRAARATSEKLLPCATMRSTALGGARASLRRRHRRRAARTPTSSAASTAPSRSPLYLTEAGIPGSELRLDADGLPEREGELHRAASAASSRTPRTTDGGAPAVPARAALYGHGLLGSANETSASHVQAFANEHNFVFCGTDWTGFAEDDQVFVASQRAQGLLELPALHRPPAPGRPELHGARASCCCAADGFASAPGLPGRRRVRHRPERPLLRRQQPGRHPRRRARRLRDRTSPRFVLGVPGINYSTLLDRSTDFERLPHRC